MDREWLRCLIFLFVSTGFLFLLSYFFLVLHCYISKGHFSLSIFLIFSITVSLQGWHFCSAYFKSLPSSRFPELPSCWPLFIIFWQLLSDIFFLGLFLLFPDLKSSPNITSYFQIHRLVLAWLGSAEFHTSFHCWVSIEGPVPLWDMLLSWQATGTKR